MLQRDSPGLTIWTIDPSAWGVEVGKGVGGGLPLGAAVFCGWSPFGSGDHGSTFGGNPVSCAAALAVLDVIERDDLLTHVRDLGDRWSASFDAIDHPLLASHRGVGLWRAIELAEPVAPAIVIRGRAPEVQPRAAIQQLAPRDCKRGHLPRGAIKDDREPVAGNRDGLGALVENNRRHLVKARDPRRSLPGHSELLPGHQVAGLGQFVAWLNGTKIGRHELDPGWTDYSKRTLYVTFDVAPWHQPGTRSLRSKALSAAGSSSIKISPDQG